ncbi:MAG: LD-carboxypeptidase [Lachnospiraceae bacterium]|nr:LD-carboxypeptidase [Lachnospiraceae bacterium]
MRYPKFLKEGGSIGFLAPSFGCTTSPYKEAFDSALAKFEALGHKTVLGPNCYADCGTGISNVPEKCGSEVNKMFASDADILISCGGGELMCEILPFVDFKELKNEAPKWFMGYSDNTNLTFLLNTLCDTASIYGPCAGSFGQSMWHESIEDAYKLLKGEKLQNAGYDMWEIDSKKSAEDPLATYNITEKRELTGFVGALKRDDLSLKGRLTGGCLDCLANLTGTRFDAALEFAEKYAEDGILWFLECCDLNPFAVRRAMWNLYEAGWFKYASGFIIGRPFHYGQEEMGLNMEKAFLEIPSKMGLPVIMGADIGHLPPMIPLISGCLAEAELKGQEFLIRQFLK